MSNSKVILAFLGGAVAGAALGILLTSDKGSKIRNDIADAARNLADSFLDQLEIMIDEAEAASANKNSEKE